MSHAITFEVRVAVEGKEMPHYSAHASDRVRSTLTKMFHIPARTPQQACDKAWKYGRPISARKICRENILDIEQIKLDPQNINVYKDGNPYKTPIAMEDMIWEKRNRRRKNMLEKDKLTID